MTTEDEEQFALPSGKSQSAIRVGFFVTETQWHLSLQLWWSTSNSIVPHTAVAQYESQRSFEGIVTLLT